MQYKFSIISMGNADGSALFNLDLSGISTGNRALLTINAFRSLILNYASNQLPSAWYLTCD